MNPHSQPLLTPAEINRLIQRAGTLNNGLKRHSNRFAQFGEQPSSVIGSGMDFADRRPYQAGDDPRFIDWRASARSRQTLIRRNHTELSNPGCVVIDRSASMAFGTRKRLKATQAVRAGVTLAAQILHSGSQLACLLLDHPDYWQPPRSDLASFQHTAGIAARPCPPNDEETPPTRWNHIIHSLINRLPQGSRVILISDFLALDSSSKQALRQLGQTFALSAIQIIDPTEKQLPDLSRLSLQWAQATISISQQSPLQQSINQTLDARLQQQAEWFKKANCQHTLLLCNDDLDALRG